MEFNKWHRRIFRVTSQKTKKRGGHTMNRQKVLKILSAIVVVIAVIVIIWAIAF